MTSDRDGALVDASKYTVEFLSLSKQKITARNAYFIYLNNSEGTLDFYQDSKYFIEYSIPLLDIVEIRDWKKSKECMAYLDDYKWTSRHFCILYGKKFIPRCIVVTSSDSSSADKLFQTTSELVQKYKKDSYTNTLSRFLRRNFNILKESFSQRNQNQLFSTLKLWFRDNNYYFKNSSDLFTCIEEFMTHLSPQQNDLSFDEFKTIYYEITQKDQENTIRKIFEFYFARDIINDKIIMTLASLKRWLAEVNQTKLSKVEAEAQEIIQKYSDNPDHITLKQFTMYLYSNENSYVDPFYTKNVYQDMNRPLSDYWIASSHNTYLVGHQWKSNASVECYARALRMGCRSVEIDCWDPMNKGDLPVIKHATLSGITFTGTIAFSHVLKMINAQAFEKSAYPIILSIENHCSLKIQKQMAKEFKNVFGDRLVIDFLSKKEIALPSPENLKYRVIIKHKKNSEHSVYYDTNGNISSMNSNPGSIDLANDNPNVLEEQEREFSKINEDGSIATNRKYLLALEGHCLYYTEISCSKSSESSIYEKIDRYDKSIRAINNIYDDLEPDADAPWFYNYMLYEDSLELFKSIANDLKTGTFLVRREHSNEYFLNVGVQVDSSGTYEVSSLRIKFSNRNEGRCFWLEIDEEKKFASIHELVRYYHENELGPINGQRALLSTGIDKVQVLASQSWFMPSKSVEECDQILQCKKKHGTFLIRNSSDEGRGKHSSHVFTLATFCMDGEYLDGKVLKFRIYSGEYGVNKYKIFNYEFDSLIELVSYFKFNTINNKLTLMESIGAYHDTITSCSSSSESLDQSNQGKLEGFLDMRKIDIKCKAERDYATIFISPLKPKTEGRKSFELGSNDALGSLIRFGGEPHDIIQFLQVLHSRQSEILNSSTNIKVIESSNFKVHPDLSAQIVYCQAKRFDLKTLRKNKFYEIYSVSDNRRFLSSEVAKQLVEIHNNTLARVYPSFLRANSLNFDPQPYWLAGFQLVALNYQSPDKPMQLNQAKFSDNGGCGYVLKSNSIRSKNFDPTRHEPSNSAGSVKLRITPIVGRHIPKRNAIFQSVFSVEVIEFENSEKKQIKSNTGFGLCPDWFTSSNGQSVEFKVSDPTIAFLRFSLRDNQDQTFLLAQSTCPVTVLRPGFRSVPLMNAYSEPLELSSLLVKLEIIKLSP